MWPVREILPHLPEHLRVCENVDLVKVHCRQCGWIVWYSALGPAADEIVRTARAHQCQGTAEGAP